MIDGYEAHTLAAETAMDYDLIAQPSGALNPYILLSGYWTKAGTGSDYLRTNEVGASLFIYATGGDTLHLLREKLTGTGPYDIYVNGTLYSTIDHTYMATLKADEQYTVSGLTGMLTGKYWIEIRNKSTYWVSLKNLQVIDVGKLGSGCAVEAELPNNPTAPSTIRAGYWLKLPTLADARFSGGFYTLSYNMLSRFYIPVTQVSYLEIHRPVGPSFGDTDIYLDGSYWGRMRNAAAVAQFSVPYAIGPIPDGDHVVELRQVNAARFAIDKVTCESMPTLPVGFYENNSEKLTGLNTAGQKVGPSLYVGIWKPFVDINASGGSLHYTTARGDRLSAIVIGNMVKIYRKTYPGGGLITVYIDGKPYPIYNNTPTIIHRSPHTILLPEKGIHSFELVVDGGRLDFDAIEIGNAVPATFGAYQENQPQVVLNGAWTPVKTTVHSEGGHVWTNRLYSSMFFLFQGRRVTAYLTQGLLWGKVKVLLDGKVIEDVDLYFYDPKNPRQDKPFYAYDLPNLSDGTHVLELRFEGGRSRGLPQTNFDVVSVDGAPVPRPDKATGPSVPDTGDGGTGGNLKVPRVGCFEEAHPEWTSVPADHWLPANFPLNSQGVCTGDAPSSCQMFYSLLAGVPTDDVYMEFDFAAAGFGLVYAKDPNGGKADIFVDDMNTPRTTLDMYAVSDQFLGSTVYEVTGLDPNVIHVVRIENSGLVGGPTGQGGRKVYIDRIDLPAYNEAYDNNCFYIE
jgi:hypothetical protein